jgi:hypothetical protein
MTVPFTRSDVYDLVQVKTIIHLKYILALNFGGLDSTFLRESGSSSGGRSSSCLLLCLSEKSS